MNGERTAGAEGSRVAFMRSLFMQSLTIESDRFDLSENISEMD